MYQKIESSKFKIERQVPAVEVLVELGGVVEHEAHVDHVGRIPIPNHPIKRLNVCNNC